MVAFLFFIFISFLHPNDIKPQSIEPGRRGDLYKVWVYFDKRDSKRIVDLDSASIERRLKHGIVGPTKNDYLINQSYIDQVKRLEVEIKNQSRWLNAVSVIADIEKINLIKKLSFVKKIEPVYKHTKKNLSKQLEIGMIRVEILNTDLVMTRLNKLIAVFRI